MKTEDGRDSSSSRDLIGLQNGGALAGLLEIAFEAVVEFDSRERITAWNPAAEQIFGWTAQEVLGKTPANLFLSTSTPEEQKSRRHRRSRLKRGEILRGEHTLCRKDGSALQVQYAERAVFNAEGTFTGSLAVYREVAAREQAQDSKQYEESLRARTEEIETLLQVSPVAIFVAHDPECIRISGNPAAYRMVGLPENPELNISKSAPREERPGYRVFRAGVEVPLQDLPMQKAARLGTEVYEEELELRFEDGSQKFVYAFAKPLFDPQGGSRGAVAALLDITERKRSEQLIRENEERFRNIFDQSPIGIGVYDADGTLVNLNRAAMDMFGIPGPEKVIGLKLFSSPTVRDEVRRKLRNQEQIREEVVYNFDEIRRLGFYETTKFGISSFDRILTPLRSASGAEPFGYLSQALDITERKRAEEQLEQSKQKLSEILESIQDDFYVIDPDWNFVYANRQFTSKLGKKPEDLVGNNVWKMFPRHIGKTLEENFRAAMEKREIRRFEISGQYTDAWYSITAFPSSEGITILGTDVTKSKRAEAEIRASQQILETMVKHIPVAVALIRGSDLRLQLINPAYQALVPGKEMVGYTLDELWPETGQDFTAICRRVLETGEAHQAVDELNMIRRQSDGELEPRYFSWSLYRVQLPGDGGWGLLNTSWETTARKQVEEALRASEQRLRQMIETSPVAIGFGNSFGKIFDANLSFYRLTGYSRAEIQTGQIGWDQLTAPEYAELDRQMMETLAAAGSAGPYEKEYIRKDGSRLPLLITVSKLPGRDEHIAFILDMTERKRAEQALAEAMQELQAHIDNSPLAIIAFDREYRITEWSASAERVFGWPADEILNRRIADVRWVHEEDVQRVTALSADMLAGRTSSNMHANRNYRKDGSVIECEWYNSALLDAQGKLLSVRSQVLDVTERKRAEAALHENQQQLQLLNETLEQQVHEKTAEVRQLAAELIKAVQRERHRLSHILHDDLQQRVYAIRMQLTFLRDHLPAQNGTAQKDVSDMETQLDEILMVTRNLSIDLSPPILRDEGLSQAINWLAVRMRQRYGLPIELQANGTFALADEELHVLLFNCVRELLFNVVKHAQATQAMVDLQWVEDNLQIEVRDNGRGFAVNAPRAQNPENIGDEEELQSSSGLPTLRHQLSLFGGRLELQSAPGAGTRVTLTVPVTGTEKET